MQKLDSEKFLLVPEAIATEKSRRRKAAAARPRVVEDRSTHLASRFRSVVEKATA